MYRMEKQPIVYHREYSIYRDNLPAVSILSGSVRTSSAQDSWTAHVGRDPV